MTRFALLLLSRTGFALLLSSPLFAQTPLLSLSGGSGVRGGSVALRLSLSASAAQMPTALQWTITYSPTDIAALNVAASTALRAAAKSLSCSGSSGKYTCVAAGLNGIAIPDGEVALATVTVASSAGSSVSVQVTKPLGVSSGGSTVALSAASAAISVSSSAAIRLNAGGPAYTDNLGRSWAADYGYGSGYSYSATAPVAGTSNSALYQSLRWDAATLKYQFAVPNGTYAVTLKFAEMYFLGTGQRRFGVAINGQQVLSNFDIVAAAGGPKIAIDRSFSTSVTNGVLVIEFLRGSADSPQINAIEIAPGAPIAVAVAPTAITLQPAQKQQFSATVSGTSNTGVTWSVSPPIGTVSTNGLYTAPSVISSNQQVVLTVASLADPGAKAFATINLAAPATPTAPTTIGSTVIRVNAGGPAYKDNLGQSWAADYGYSSGYTYSVTVPIAGTSNPALYQSLRWEVATLKYQFAVPNGTYAVTLKFAEMYFLSAGQRRFGVAINGQQVLSNFDIVASAGGPKIAVDRSFTTSVTNGVIVIEFLRGSADDPQINAIEIHN